MKKERIKVPPNSTVLFTSQYRKKRVKRKANKRIRLKFCYSKYDKQDINNKDAEY